MDHGDFDPTDIHTSDEADALLRDDDPFLSNAGKTDNGSMETNDTQVDTMDSSPTAAIWSIIEAQINEGMSSEVLQFDFTLTAKNKPNAVLF